VERAAEFTRKQRGTLAQRYKELRREKDAWKEGVDSLGLHSSDSRRKVLKVL
jgi:FtsZ-binding cell division protein ZapB